MDGEVLIPISLFAGIFGVIALRIVAGPMCDVVRHWQIVSLKIRMVDAGYSPADIERVIQAGSDLDAVDVPASKDTTFKKGEVAGGKPV